MATSEDPILRAIAAGHPRIDANMLTALLMDSNVEVRRAAVKNPSVTPFHIRTAKEDADKGIAAYAMMIEEGEDG